MTNQISTYPNNLRMYRLQTKLSQAKVAKLLKLDCKDRISRWETGVAGPCVVNLFRLAIIYKASPQDLFPETWQTIEKQLLLPDQACDILQSNQGSITA